MGGVGAIDVATAPPNETAVVVRTWVEAAYAAWSEHHAAIRELTTRLLA